MCIPVPASGLRDLKVYIPDTVLRGHNIHFNCTFTLEDEKLFAIKWYRGNYEIFRYMPSSNAPKKTFPLEGYNVSVSSLLFSKCQKCWCENEKDHSATKLILYALKTFFFGHKSCKYANLQWSVAYHKKGSRNRIYYYRKCRETTIQRCALTLP